MMDVMGARSAAPGTLAEAAATLSDAAVGKAAVAFRGGGTELGFGYPLSRVDLLLRTERLTRIVEYAPADLVVEVEAGLTLAALQTRLAAERQRLALDAPLPELATLGGLAATNAFGPLRARFGSIRDLIVGVTLIRADGTRVRGGGKVVKNVAGFDLPKLAVGSLGTLGMIATLTFRLHPLPETTSVACVRDCAGPQLRRFARELNARQMEVSALVAIRREAAYDVYVVFEGFEAGVAEQRERFRTLASELGTSAEAVERSRQPTRLDETVRTYGNVRLRLAVPPASLDVLERDALSPLYDAFADAKASVYPSLGVAFFSAYAGDDSGAERIVAARGVAERLGGNAVVLDRLPPALGERVDVYGTLPPSFPLMARLKDRFDPEHRFNPGRFLGGL